MKLLFLSKRAPQQRDLISRPYGRFHFLPLELSRRGHQVEVFLLDHRSDATISECATSEAVRRSVFGFRGTGMLSLQSRLNLAAESLAPDWVVGCSDSWVGVLAARLARRRGSRLCIDAYDNYESYMPWNLPLRALWRSALASADLVSAAGPQLANLLDRTRPGKPRATIVPMAADPAFAPSDRQTSRETLGLPADKPIFGYYGGWASRRGTDLLVTAFREIRAKVPDALLVLTGRPPAEMGSEPGVVLLGYVDDGALPMVINALDVAFVVTADSSFGRYSYPSKLCEAMACGIPVVATSTEPVRWMLRERNSQLSPLADAFALAEKAILSIGLGRLDYGQLPTWQQSAGIWDQALSTV